MACFSIGDYNVLPKKELHRRLQVDLKALPQVVRRPCSVGSSGKCWVPEPAHRRDPPRSAAGGPASPLPGRDRGLGARRSKANIIPRVFSK